MNELSNNQEQAMKHVHFFYLINQIGSFALHMVQRIWEGQGWEAKAREAGRGGVGTGPTAHSTTSTSAHRALQLQAHQLIDLGSKLQGQLVEYLPAHIRVGIKAFIQHTSK
jgi:hypothetical protein